MLLLGLASLLDLFWPSTGNGPKPIRWARLVLLSMVPIFLVSGGWRHFAWELHPNQSAVRATALRTTPDHGGQGKTLTVTIRASDPTFSEASMPNFGPDISVLAHNVVDPTTLRADVQVAPGAPIGGRRVWISTPGRETTIDNTRDGAFQVVEAAGAEKPDYPGASGGLADPIGTGHFDQAVPAKIWVVARRRQGLSGVLQALEGLPTRTFAIFQPGVHGLCRETGAREN